MKQVLISRTFWIAVLQAVLGAVLAFTPDMPPYLGIALIGKSIVDVIIRFTNGFEPTE